VTAELNAHADTGSQCQLPPNRMAAAFADAAVANMHNNFTAAEQLAQHNIQLSVGDLTEGMLIGWKPTHF